MSRHYIMCRPTYFAVDYVINPWMDPTTPVDVELAVAQWETLRRTYLRMGHTVDLIDPVPGLPDMVFAANGALIIDGAMLGSQFRHPERAAEAPAFLDWGDRHGLEVHEAKAVNEGEGDMLLTRDFILAALGTRTELSAHAQAQEIFGRPVISLQLVDPRYYHLDTALCVLRPDHIAYYPAAFSPGSQAVLRQLFPDAVQATAEDAAAFGLNAVSDGHRVVLPVRATGLARTLAALGYKPVPVDVSELLKAGGGPKCCTLEVRHAPAGQVAG
jgi:N-dimethylarginine dimethylaminohydrolase